MTNNDKDELNSSSVIAKSGERRIRSSSLDQKPSHSITASVTPKSARRRRVHRSLLERETLSRSPSSISNEEKLKCGSADTRGSGPSFSRNDADLLTAEGLLGKTCEIDPSVQEQSRWLPEGVSQSGLHGILRKGLSGWKDPTEPIFIPLAKPEIVDPPQGVRRSTRIRIHPVRRPFEKVEYSRRINPTTNRWEDVPIGHCVYPSDAEIRKRKKQLSAMAAELNRTRAKAKRTARLVKLCAKRRREVQMMKDGEFSFAFFNYIQEREFIVFYSVFSSQFMCFSWHSFDPTMAWLRCPSRAHCYYYLIVKYKWEMLRNKYRLLMFKARF